MEFCLFIEELAGGKFTGRIIDWNGIGANGEVSEVNGFIEADFISFTKQYDRRYDIDELGNQFISPDVPGHCVTYEGKFDHHDKCFKGSWEITLYGKQAGDFLIEEIVTGKWRMKHAD